MTVTGEEIPEASILLQRLQEALQQGTTRVNIINGYVVDTNSSVRLSVGPVLGEITATTAIMMRMPMHSAKPRVRAQQRAKANLLLHTVSACHLQLACWLSLGLTSFRH